MREGWIDSARGLAIIRYWFFFVLATRAAPAVRSAAPRMRVSHVIGVAVTYGLVLDKRAESALDSGLGQTRRLGGI